MSVLESPPAPLQHKQSNVRPELQIYKMAKYFQVLEKTGRLPGQKDQGFTTVGKPKMASKQYNSPMKMYSEDIIEEIMTQGTAFGKEIDPSNPWNMTGKQFDAAKSGVLAAIMTDMSDDQTKVNNNHQIG